MSNKAHRRSAAEQYELIMECRSIGMSDHQWCVAHDINPGTFYNWVKRLRQKGGYEIPQPANSSSFSPAPKQDVVKMEILPEICIPQQPGIEPMPMSKAAIQTAPIEISFGNLKISLTNDADPCLLSQIFSALRGGS